MSPMHDGGFEKEAKEIAKDAYIHNTSSTLNPSVCRTTRIRLQTDILEALQQADREAVERCARKAEMFSVKKTPIHPDMSIDQMNDGAKIAYHSTAQQIAKAIRDSMKEGK